MPRNRGSTQAAPPPIAALQTRAEMASAAESATINPGRAAALTFTHIYLKEVAPYIIAWAALNNIGSEGKKTPIQKEYFDHFEAHFKKILTEIWGDLFLPSMRNLDLNEAKGKIFNIIKGSLVKLDNEILYKFIDSLPRTERDLFIYAINRYYDSFITKNEVLTFYRSQKDSTLIYHKIKWSNTGPKLAQVDYTADPSKSNLTTLIGVTSLNLLVLFTNPLFYWIAITPIILTFLYLINSIINVIHTAMDTHKIPYANYFSNSARAITLINMVIFSIFLFKLYRDHKKNIKTPKRIFSTIDSDAVSVILSIVDDLFPIPTSNAPKKNPNILPTIAYNSLSTDFSQGEMARRNPNYVKPDASTQETPSVYVDITPSTPTITHIFDANINEWREFISLHPTTHYIGNVYFSLRFPEGTSNDTIEGMSQLMERNKIIPRDSKGTNGIKLFTIDPTQHSSKLTPGYIKYNEWRGHMSANRISVTQPDGSRALGILYKVELIVSKSDKARIFIAPAPHTGNRPG